MRNVLVSILVLCCSYVYAANVGVTVSSDSFGAGIITASDTTGKLWINCNNVTSTGNCSAQVPAGTKLSFKATPQAGALFVGWNLGTGSLSSCSQVGNQTNSTCVAIINVASSVKYSFNGNPPQQSLSVSFAIGGKGTVSGKFQTGTSIFNCTTNCAKGINSGTIVVLNAVPAPNTGSTFVKWSNGTGSAAVCNGTSNPCKFAIGQPSSIAVTFSTPQHPLKVTTGASGTGTVVSDPTGPINCASPGTSRTCSATVTQGTVRLKATPGAGSVFSTWSDGTGSAAVCNGSNAPICTFTITQGSTIRANFVLSNL